MISARLLLFPCLWVMAVFAQPVRSVYELIKTGHPVQLRGSSDAAWDEFGKALGDARIVVIGGNATVSGDLEMRLRLTQYLREKKGFGVLLLDAGLYDGERARQEYLFGDLGREVLAGSLSYGLASELDPLVKLMNIGSDRTTAFVQGGYLPLSHRAAPALAADLQEYLQKRVPERCLPEPFQVLNAALAHLAPSTATPVAATPTRLTLASVLPVGFPSEVPVAPAGVDTTSLNAAIAVLIGHLDACDKIFPKQAFASDFYREALAGVRLLARGAVRGTPGYIRALGARHLAWLVEKRYPTEKIVIWADNPGALRPGHEQPSLAPYQSFLADFQAQTLAATRTIFTLGTPLDAGGAIENELTDFTGWIPLTGNTTSFTTNALGNIVAARWGTAVDMVLSVPKDPSVPTGAPAGSAGADKCVSLLVRVTDSAGGKPVPFATLHVGTLSYTTNAEGMCDMRIPLPFADEIVLIEASGYHYLTSQNVLTLLQGQPGEAGKTTPLVRNIAVHSSKGTPPAAGSDAASVMKNVLKKRDENYPSRALEQRGVLRTGTADSSKNVVVAAIVQRRTGFSSANPWLARRRTGVQVVEVETSAFTPAMMLRADEALGETLAADVISGTTGPLGIFSRGAFTFTHEGTFVSGKQAACHKIAFTCTRPDMAATGLAKVSAYTGILWIDSKTFAVTRSETTITFADGRTLNRMAVYGDRGKEGWAPVFLHAKHTSKNGEAHWDEWYTRTTTNAVTRPLYGTFASAQLPATLNNRDFWTNFWHYCWSR